MRRGYKVPVKRGLITKEPIMTAWTALGPTGRVMSVLRLLFGFEVLMGLAMGGLVVAVMALIALPLERLRPDVQAACETSFIEFISTGDLVSLERARISLEALGCDLRGRLTRQQAK